MTQQEKVSTSQRLNRAATV